MLRQLSNMFEKNIDKMLEKNYNISKDVISLENNYTGNIYMLLSIQIYTLIFIILGVCLFLLAIVLLLVLLKKKNSKKIKIDDEFIFKLLTALGGKENLVNASFVNGRVNFEVQDIDLAQLDQLKVLSTAGVFVTNNVIKMLFNYDSELICKTIMK